MTIDNGYPQYICTVTVEVTNGASIPAAIDPAVIEADEGLEVIQISNPPGIGIIGPGETAEVVFAVRIFNSAPQDSVRSLTITTLVINPGRILFWRHLAGAGEIGVMDFDGTNDVIFWESPVNFPDTQPAWSPDGTQIAFVRGGSAGARDVYVMPSTGVGPRTLVTPDGRHPDWSPDSMQIVFHASRIHPARTEIYTIPVAGGSPTLVHRDADQADWSPDGSQIAFRHITTDLKQIWVVNADGSNPVNISNSAFTDEWPDWSPDGSQILFTRNVPSFGSREVFVMNADGTGVTQLTSIGGVAEKPHWSPDGSRILFSRFGEIWLMDADGANIGHIGSGGDPSWEQFGP
jgi:TolB protein